MRVWMRWALLFAAVAARSVAAGELSGEAGIEMRLFPHDGLDNRQHASNLSLSLEPEFYHDWRDGDERFVVVPYFRLDQGDPARRHFDLRELYWRRSFATADLYIGIRKVFWGVTESLHLVDVVNQTDLVENPDTEDKLGQPMVQLTLLRHWGTIDLYLMPYFRERTFPGAKGRLRPSLPVDVDGAVYAADAAQWHPSLAARWSHILGNFDVGLGHFYGTSREPRFVVTEQPGGTPSLVPHYDLLRQTSLDLQYTQGDWLGKLEAVYRDGADGPSTAAVAMTTCSSSLFTTSKG